MTHCYVDFKKEFIKYLLKKRAEDMILFSFHNFWVGYIQ